MILGLAMRYVSDWPSHSRVVTMLGFEYQYCHFYGGTTLTVTAREWEGQLET